MVTNFFIKADEGEAFKVSRVFKFDEGIENIMDCIR